MTNILQPLSWQVWILHVGMMLLGASAIFFMEAGSRPRK